MNRFLFIITPCLVCIFPVVALAGDDRLDAGPLTLEIYVSETANLFHAVDQISEWSEFCHRQYVAYFEGLDGEMSKEDRDLLAQHRAIRRTHGWGGGLEQTFYTALDLDAALALGVKQGHLSKEEAETERQILTHFKGRVEQLVTEEASTLERFIEGLKSKQSDLLAFAKDASRFVDGAELTVPVYLIANPHERNCGGGFNGGRLTLEIAKNYDMYPTFLHELFHAFLTTKQESLRSAATSVPGLNLETLSEGLAHAYSPGLFQTGDSEGTDLLLSSVRRYRAQGKTLSDSLFRFRVYGLAIRPLLKDALFGERQTLDVFLPRATDAWLVLTEVEGASGSQPHDYKKDTRHSVFVFGYDILGNIDWNAFLKSVNLHFFGRNHVAKQYENMLTNRAKPGDTIILLLSLDHYSRMPEEFSDLLPSPWPEVESRLEREQIVFKQRKARDMNVFLLAAPTTERLRNEFQRLVAEAKFTPDAGAQTE